MLSNQSYCDFYADKLQKNLNERPNMAFLHLSGLDPIYRNNWNNLSQARRTAINELLTTRFNPGAEGVRIVAPVDDRNDMCVVFIHRMRYILGKCDPATRFGLALTNMIRKLLRADGNPWYTLAKNGTRSGVSKAEYSAYLATLLQPPYFIVPIQPIPSLSISRKRDVNMAMLKEAKNRIKTRRINQAYAERFAVVCPGLSGDCVAFGQGQKALSRFFYDFKIRRNPVLIHSFRSIGDGPSYSSNGFVKLIEFQKHGYTASAILKSSKKQNADNLLYEYIVGRFLNEYVVPRYTCFVHTHGLYKYVDDASYVSMRETSPTVVNGVVTVAALPNRTIDELLDSIREYTISDAGIVDGCETPERYAILVQNFGDNLSLDNYLSGDYPDVEENLFKILYQIYYPLNKLKDNYTHYDLHPGNILLYTVPNGMSVRFEYVIDGEPHFFFTCRYIAKIIDYGRNYFYESPT